MLRQHQGLERLHLLYVWVLSVHDDYWWLTIGDWRLTVDGWGLMIDDDDDDGDDDDGHDGHDGHDDDGDDDDDDDYDGHDGHDDDADDDDIMRYDLHMIVWIWSCYVLLCYAYYHYYRYDDECVYSCFFALPSLIVWLLYSVIEYVLGGRWCEGEKYQPARIPKTCLWMWDKQTIAKLANITPIYSNNYDLWYLYHCLTSFNCSYSIHRVISQQTLYIYIYYGLESVSNLL